MALRRLAACAVLGVLAACGGSDHGGSSLNPLPAEYQGSWTRVSCMHIKDSTSLSNISLSVGATTYVLVGTLWIASSACVGPSEDYEERGTVNNAGTMTVSSFATPVSALEIDRTPSGMPTVYDLVYVDTTPSPDRLFLGYVTDGHDGTTLEKRFNNLETTGYFEKN